MREEIKHKAKGLPLQIGLALLLFWIFKNAPLLQNSVKAALSVCFDSLIPSLFPFFILSDLLSQTKEGEKLLAFLSRPVAFLLRTDRKSAGAYISGLLLGFPMGVKQLAEGYADGIIEKSEAERLLLISNNTGPAFVIGCLGGLLGSLRSGVLIYVAQLFVSLFFGFLLRPRVKKPHSLPLQPKHTASPPSSFSLVESIPRAALHMLSVCAYVLFFSAFSSILFPIFVHPFIKALLLSVFEIGTASAFITSSLCKLRIPFCAFAVCFSGISVYCQGKEIWKKRGLSAPKYLLFKLMQGALAFLLLLPFTN